MFCSRKVLVALLVVALVTEEVASHKLLLAPLHIANKIAIAKLHLLRPIARGLALKKILAVKLLGAKALIGAKVGAGALAYRHLKAGLATIGAKRLPIAPIAYGKTAVGAVRSAPVAPAAPVQPLAAIRSAITLPEINVPVRFSVGGPGPAIRGPAVIARQAGKV